MKYVTVKVHSKASRRTKNRFSKFVEQEHRIELIKSKNNETFNDDGFVKGEPMTYFGIDLFHDDLWSRAWEGWIPNNEIDFEIID